MNIDKMQTAVEQLSRIAEGREPKYVLYEEMIEICGEALNEIDAMEYLFEKLATTKIDFFDDHLEAWRKVQRLRRVKRHDQNSSASSLSSRYDDPIVVYLAELRHAPRLAKSEELRLAKDLAEGHIAILNAVMRSEIYTGAIRRIVNQLLVGDVNLGEIVSRGSDTAKMRKSPQEAARLMLRSLDKIAGWQRRLHSERRELSSAAEGVHAAKLFRKIQRREQECMERFSGLDLAPHLITRFSNRIIVVYSRVKNARVRIGQISESRGVFRDGMGSARVDSFREEEGSDSRILEALREVESLSRTIQRLEREVGMPEEVISEIGEAIEQGRQRVDGAQRTIIESNMSLVISIAKEYTDRGVEFLDLIQEGNSGLVRAMDRYDYHKGYKFSVFAASWVRGAMERAIADQARTIRVPAQLSEAIAEVRYASGHLLQALGREPTPAEVAAFLEVPLDLVVGALEASLDPVFLDQHAGEDEDETLRDFIVDDTGASPAQLAAEGLFKERMRRAVSVLDRGEEEIVRLRFGIDTGRAFSIADIAATLGSDHEQVRKILKCALLKLRQTDSTTGLLSRSRNGD